MVRLDGGVGDERPRRVEETELNEGGNQGRNVDVGEINLAEVRVRVVGVCGFDGLLAGEKPEGLVENGPAEEGALGGGDELRVQDISERKMRLTSDGVEDGRAAVVRDVFEARSVRCDRRVPHSGMRAAGLRRDEIVRVTRIGQRVVVAAIDPPNEGVDGAGTRGVGENLGFLVAPQIPRVVRREGHAESVRPVR